jgi:hypothetical protein
MATCPARATSNRKDNKGTTFLCDVKSLTSLGISTSAVFATRSSGMGREAIAAVHVQSFTALAGGLTFSIELQQALCSSGFSS